MIMVLIHPYIYTWSKIPESIWLCSRLPQSYVLPWKYKIVSDKLHKNFFLLFAICRFFPIILFKWRKFSKNKHLKSYSFFVVFSFFIHLFPEFSHSRLDKRLNSINGWKMTYQWWYSLQTGGDPDHSPLWQTLVLGPSMIHPSSHWYCTMSPVENCDWSAGKMIELEGRPGNPHLGSSSENID